MAFSKVRNLWIAVFFVFGAASTWAWNDATWQWAANEFGLVFYLKTENGCSDHADSKVRVKIQNTQDFAMVAEFRVTNAYWSKTKTLELAANATDSSLVILPEDRTCRPLVDRITATPKDAPVAGNSDTE